MLDALKKKLLGDKPDEQLAEVAEEVVTEAVTQNVEQSLATDLQSALSQVEELNAALQAKDSLLAELNSKLEALSEFAAKAEAHAEALRVEAEQKALAEKREKLANVIGADNPKLDAVFAPLAALEASAFDVVISAMAASFEAEASSEMFKEVGVSGEAEVKPAAQNESAEMRIIKQLAKQA